MNSDVQLSMYMYNLLKVKVSHLCTTNSMNDIPIFLQLLENSLDNYKFKSLKMYC